MSMKVCIVGQESSVFAIDYSFQGYALIAENVSCVRVRRDRPFICFRQNPRECSSFLKPAGVIDDHYLFLYSALGTTVL